MIKRHTDFQDMMNVSIETEDKWLNRKLNSHICYGKGGGGGGGQQQQDVPPTLRPYVTDVLNRAKVLYGSGQPYQAYEGERVVPFTAEELAAQEGITEMVGRGISQDPFLSSAGAYYAPAYGLLGEAGALQAGAAREITADEIMGRMSPYQQAVTDITKREAMKEAQLYGQKLKGQAATTGGFGGSRQAILEAQAASDLGGRLADIQSKGQQEAYMNALAMAEQQRAREMGAGQALSGLSGMYGNLGQQALGQAYRELGYLSGVGEAQRGMGQQRADIAYEEFIKQREYPTEQLQKYSSLIQGFPFQFSQGIPQLSPMQQFTSGALAVGGLGKGLGFFKEGGQINSGLSGVVYRQPGGAIDPNVAAERKRIEELQKEIKKLKDFDDSTPGYNLKTKQKIDRLEQELSSITDTVPTALQFLANNPSQKNFRTGRPTGNMTDAQRAAMVRQNQIDASKKQQQQAASNSSAPTQTEEVGAYTGPLSYEQTLEKVQAYGSGDASRTAYAADLLERVKGLQIPFDEKAELEKAEANKRYAQMMTLLQAAKGVSSADPRQGFIPALVEGASQGGEAAKGIFEAEQAIKDIPKLKAQADLTNILTELKAAEALKDYGGLSEAPDISTIKNDVLENTGRSLKAIQNELAQKNLSIEQIASEEQEKIRQSGITDKYRAEQAFAELFSARLNKLLKKEDNKDTDQSKEKTGAPDSLDAVTGV